MKELKIIAIPDLPIFKKGDNVAQIILGASKNNGILIDRNDIVVIAQKMDVKNRNLVHIPSRQIYLISNKLAHIQETVRLRDK